MRSVFLFTVLFFVNLYSNEFCHNIQIGSFNKTSLKKIKKLSVPKECFIFKKENGYAIRCECDNKKEIIKKLALYKERFADAFITKSNRTLFEKRDINTSGEESLEELMYKVFIYNGDLKNAYKVVIKELKKEPSNLVWKRRLADILLWTGKSSEALKEYAYIYKKTKDQKLEKLILSSSIKGRDYKDAYPILMQKILAHPDNMKIIDKFIEVAKGVGEIEKSALFLDRIYKKTRSAALLKKIANLYLKAGNPKEAKRRFMLLLRAKMIDTDSAVKLGRIFFIQKDLKGNLKVLLSVKKRVKPDDVNYWEELGNIYSYLNQEKKAILITTPVCLKKKCSKESYDRLIRYYSHKDKNIASKFAQKAYENFKKPYYFFHFAKLSIEKKRAEDVLKIIKRFSPKERREFEKKPLFWLIKAKIYESLNQPKKASVFYEKALLSDPSSFEILSQYALFLTKQNRIEKLKRVITQIEKNSSDERFYLLAALDFRINKIQKAYKYYKKAVQNDPDNTDLKLDFANFLTVIGKNREGLEILRKIYQKLHTRFEEDKSLMKNRLFLKRYLRSSLYFLSYIDYKTLLKYAKNHLSHDEYKEFEIIWRLHQRNDEYVEFLANRLKNPKIWLKLYLSNRKNDTASLKDLLYRYEAFLPIEGKIEALIKTKQIGSAKKSTFNALEENPSNKKLYKTKYKLDTKYGNKLTTEAGYENREELKRKYMRVENLYHLLNRYYFGSLFEYGDDKYKDDFNDIEAKVWLKILTNSGYAKIGAAYRDIDDPYFEYFVNFYSYLSDRLSLELEIAKNKKADESIALFLEGCKDTLSLSSLYNFNQRISLALQMSANRYKLQNGLFLGKGYKFDAQLKEKIKFGYPDISFREFITFARFSDNGILELPDNYTEGGVGMEIGKNYQESYNGNWRSYLDLSVVQNTLFGLSLGGEVGIGGRFLGDDNLNISLNYNRSAGDSNDELWLFKLRHKYLY